MAAHEGNQFWKARATHGRDKIFTDPEILWAAACEYFQWVEDNPLYEAKAFSFKGESWIEEIPKMRAMTLNGLYLFLGIAEATFSRYAKDEDFKCVCDLIKKTIYEQKFTGAAADLLNSNIIARDLGLTDKGEVDHKSSDGSMTPSFDAAMYKAAQSKLDDLD